MRESDSSADPPRPLQCALPRAPNFLGVGGVKPDSTPSRPNCSLADHHAAACFTSCVSYPSQGGRFRRHRATAARPWVQQRDNARRPVHRRSQITAGPTQAPEGTTSIDQSLQAGRAVVAAATPRQPMTPQHIRGKALCAEGVKRIISATSMTGDQKNSLIAPLSNCENSACQSNASPGVCLGSRGNELMAGDTILRLSPV